MKYFTKIIIFISITCLVVWFFADQHRIQNVINSNTILLCIWVGFIYILSHIIRILRLGFLVVDQKKYIPELTKAHIYTAFPSLLMPFKLGEVLRFIYIVGVFQDRQKGICVWLVERLCDLVTLTGVFLILSILKVELPETILFYLKVFAFIGLAFIFSIFAFSQAINYLSHFIILNSSSERGLRILKVNSLFTQFEAQILELIRGRVLGLVFLTMIIWFLEISAIFLVFKDIDIEKINAIKIFSESLLDRNLSFNDGVDNQYFGTYKAISLAIFVAMVLVIIGIKKVKK